MEDSGDEEDDDESGGASGMFVNPDEIEATARRKMSKEERIAALKDARADREKFSLGRGHSQKVAQRNKNYLMKVIGKKSKGLLGRVGKATGKKKPKRQFKGRFSKRFGKHGK